MCSEQWDYFVRHAENLSPWEVFWALLHRLHYGLILRRLFVASAKYEWLHRSASTKFSHFRFPSEQNWIPLYSLVKIIFFLVKPMLSLNQAFTRYFFILLHVCYTFKTILTSPHPPPISLSFALMICLFYLFRFIDFRGTVYPAYYFNFSCNACPSRLPHSPFKLFNKSHSLFFFQRQEQGLFCLS